MATGWRAIEEYLEPEPKPPSGTPWQVRFFFWAACILVLEVALIAIVNLA
jgi:hypothetical protein